MAQSIVNFRLDENIKKAMEKVCKDMGMSMSTAFTIFATKVARERRIPFEITADPFYSSKNMDYINSIIEKIENGKANLKENTLIEE